MINFEEKLNGCFRKDVYKVYDPKHPFVGKFGSKQKHHEFEEFFV